MYGATGAAASYWTDARMYDTRLGRWMSTDPKEAKYAMYSPYIGLGDNPIAMVDRDGRENVIYFVYLPSQNKQISLTEAKAIIAEANRVFKKLGLETRVALVNNNTKFNPNNLDVTDAVIVAGTPANVHRYLAKHTPIPQAALFSDWQGGSNVEKTQNETGGSGNLLTDATYAGGGRWAVIDISSLPTLNDRVGLTVIQFGAYIITHSAGHMSGEDHWLDGSRKYTKGYTESHIMASASGILNIDIVNVLRRGGYENLMSNKPEKANEPGRNADYITAMGIRFGIANKSSQGNHNPK